MRLKKQLRNNNRIKSSHGSIEKTLTMPKLYSYINKTNYKLSYMKHPNKIFVCQPASLTTGNDLLPKPIGIEPAFFVRAKLISVHTNLSCTDKDSCSA